MAGQGALRAQDSDVVRERPRGRGQRVGGLALAPAAALAGGEDTATWEAASCRLAAAGAIEAAGSPLTAQPA